MVPAMSRDEEAGEGWQCVRGASRGASDGRGPHVELISASLKSAGASPSATILSPSRRVKKAVAPGTVVRGGRPPRAQATAAAAAALALSATAAVATAPAIGRAPAKPSQRLPGDEWGVVATPVQAAVSEASLVSQLSPQKAAPGTSVSPRGAKPSAAVGCVSAPVPAAPAAAAPVSMSILARPRPGATIPRVPLAVSVSVNAAALGAVRVPMAEPRAPPGLAAPTLPTSRPPPSAASGVSAARSAILSALSIAPSSMPQTSCLLPGGSTQATGAVDAVVADSVTPRCTRAVAPGMASPTQGALTEGLVVPLPSSVRSGSLALVASAGGEAAASAPWAAALAPLPTPSDLGHQATVPRASVAVSAALHHARPDVGLARATVPLAPIGSRHWPAADRQPPARSLPASLRTSIWGGSYLGLGGVLASASLVPTSAAYPLASPLAPLGPPRLPLALPLAFSGSSPLLPGSKSASQPFLSSTSPVSFLPVAAPAVGGGTLGFGLPAAAQVIRW